MLKYVIAATAFVALSTTAQAGTLQNGVWTPNCPAVPGDPPEFNTKSPEAFNKSQKAVQEWQSGVIAYNDCMKGEVKTDQEIIVGAANSSIKKLSDELSGLSAAQQAAVETLKKKGSH
jgi:hypothetical protein